MCVSSACPSSPSLPGKIIFPHPYVTLNMVPQMPLPAYSQASFPEFTSSFRIEMCVCYLPYKPHFMAFAQWRIFTSHRTVLVWLAPKAQEWVHCVWLLHFSVLLPHCGSHLPRCSPVAWFSPPLKSYKTKGPGSPAKPPITILAVSSTESPLGILLWV